MLILDNKVANVTYHENGNYVAIEYKKFAKSTAFREVWEKAGEVVIEKQINKYLSDSRTMSVVSVEDQKWLADDWAMRIRVAVPKDSFTAIVLDKNAFAEISAKSIASSLTENKSHDVSATFEFFKDINAAKDWLKNVEHQLKPLAR